MKTNHDAHIRALRETKLRQTQDKITREGLLDEDDYGRIAPPADGAWRIIPNHADGSFYGLTGWTENFCDLMDKHPVYVDPRDAFAGRWMYFMSKMRPNIWNPDYPYDHLRPEIERYDIIHGIGNDAHFAPDYQLGLTLGWGGILAKIATCRAQHAESPEKQQFYDCHRRAVESIQGWIRRTSGEIRARAARETDPEARANLAAMAETNDAVLSAPPRTFRQACQWIIWYHLASRTYNRDGAGGQLDELLRPYYERDSAAGILDDGQAVYFLACLLLNDPIYWQLGGPDQAGRDVTSRLSYLVLEAADKINTSINLTVRVHDGLDEAFFQKAVHCLIKNKNAWPRFSGDKALVEGFTRNGYSVELARSRIAVGCNWMSLPGQEYTMNDLVKVSIAKVFAVSLDEMMADPAGGPSTARLWEIFGRHLARAVGTAADCIRHQLRYQKYNEPELLLNLLSHGPLEKGLDVSDGGAMFYNLAIDGAGLATVADSFAALEQRIEQEGRTSWAEVKYHLDGDWEGMDGERLRLLLHRSQRYGAGHSLGDKWAAQLNELFTALVRGQSQAGSRQVFIPGWFSWANTVGFGKKLGATPNGRRAGAPISHGANPHPGFSPDGASTALSNAVALIQPGFGNTAPMQWELDPMLAAAESQPIVAAIIKTHFAQGGTLINVNIVDRDRILAAHRDPQSYPDLVVRVTGFTAYFAMLTPQFRQLVVDRILEN